MNVLTLTGHLHSDPARRDTSKGIVATFRLAVDANRHRLWIDVECWGQLAGTVHTHLVKGRHVAVTGSLRHNQYTDRNDQRRDHYFVAADRISYLDGPTDTRPDGRPTAAADTVTA